jgi:hypothetical protein
MAEGLEDVAWTWLEMLAAGHGPDHRQGLARLLLVKIVAEKGRSHDLDPALAAVLRADDMFGAGAAHSAAFVGDAWHKLAKLLTLERRPKPPSEALFDSFVGVADHLQHPSELAVTHLDLRHPTRPSADRAIRLFGRPQFWTSVTSPLEAAATATAAEAVAPPQRWVRRVVCMGVDLADHLSEAGQTEKAKWVIGLLWSNLGGQLRGFVLPENRFMLDGGRVP